MHHQPGLRLGGGQGEGLLLLVCGLVDGLVVERVFVLLCCASPTAPTPLNPPNTQVSHDDVMEQGAAAANKMRRLLVAAVPRMSAAATAADKAAAAAAAAQH